jgi:glutathione synthase/RimK-type ligase-like ATP-grasp enzyme
MSKSVLILAEENDTHARVIAATLWKEHRLQSFIWSFTRFPQAKLNFGLTNGGGLETISSTFLPGNQQIHSIWWRRPGEPTIAEDIKDANTRRFVRAEAEQFLIGILESFGAPIINSPRHQRSAARKPLQLSSAIKAGLKIPRTLMSNDPDQIRKFWLDLEGKCVYKAFSSPPWTAIETRRLTHDDLKEIESTRLSPIIVQEEIERACDVRVNVFAEEIFACKVEPKHPIAEVDSRLDVTAVWEPLTLPGHVANSVRVLMNLLKLDYGCIDMRQRPNGDFFFFEINPAGQFLFAEIDTGQPLSSAMAQLLLQGSRFLP